MRVTASARGRVRSRCAPAAGQHTAGIARGVGAPTLQAKSLKSLAGVRGLEPATSDVTGQGFSSTTQALFQAEAQDRELSPAEAVRHEALLRAHVLVWEGFITNGLRHAIVNSGKRQRNSWLIGSGTHAGAARHRAPASVGRCRNTCPRRQTWWGSRSPRGGSTPRCWRAARP